MGLVEEHLAVLDRCVGLPGVRTEAVAWSARGDRETVSSRRRLRSALQDPLVIVSLIDERLIVDEIQIPRIVHRARGLHPFPVLPTRISMITRGPAQGRRASPQIAAVPEERTETSLAQSPSCE